MSGPRMAAAVLAIAVVTLAAACGSNGDPVASTGDAPAPTTASTSTTSSTTPSTGGGDTTPSTRGPRTPGSTAALPSEGVPNADLEATVEAPDVTWLDNPSEYRGQPNARVAYECPPDGVVSTVWGVDVYTDDPSVCTAAVHAGLITVADGGRVVIEIRGGREAYEGSVANGVTTLEYASWPGSFVFPGV